MFQVLLLHRVLLVPVACQNRKVGLVRGQAISHKVTVTIFIKDQSHLKAQIITNVKSFFLKKPSLYYAGTY